MTTIVATREGIWSDSKVSLDHLNLSYPAVKIQRGKDCVFGAAGNGGDCSKFLDWASEGFKGKEPVWSNKSQTDDYLLALVVKADGIYFFHPGDILEKIELDMFAIGSGGKAARVALMLGQTPEEAIRLAAEVDPGTGGPIQKLIL